MLSARHGVVPVGVDCGSRRSDRNANGTLRLNRQIRHDTTAADRTIKQSYIGTS